jgi:hypothetical protein
MILYFQFKSVINEAAKRTPELGWRPPFVAENRNADRIPFPVPLRLEAQSIVQSASTGTRHPCISL